MVRNKEKVYYSALYYNQEGPRKSGRTGTE